MTVHNRGVMLTFRPFYCRLKDQEESYYMHLRFRSDGSVVKAYCIVDDNELDATQTRSIESTYRFLKEYRVEVINNVRTSYFVPS